MGESRQVCRVFPRHGPVPPRTGVVRAVTMHDFDCFDPFFVLDEFRSESPGDLVAIDHNEPDQPFNCITYVLAGALSNTDSEDVSGLLTSGTVRWATSGSGFADAMTCRQEEGLLWGFRLCFAGSPNVPLPVPGHWDIPEDQIPEINVAPGVTAKVIAGELGDSSGPVTDVDVDPLYLDVYMQAGSHAQFIVATTHTVLMYVYGGCVDSVTSGGSRVASAELALFEERRGDNIELSAVEDSRFLLLAGKPAR